MVNNGDREPDFEELVDECIKAVRAGDDAFWRIGDLTLQVTRRYSKENRLQEFADRVHVAYSTLASYRRVAEAFPESSRRPQLSWSHHLVVAKRKDAGELLAKA